jgi:hypothetical protein
LWSTIFRLISAGWLPHSRRFVRSCLCLKWRGFEPRLYRLTQTRILLTWPLPDLESLFLTFRTTALLEATSWELARATISTRPVLGYPPIPAGTRSFERPLGTSDSIVAARMMAQMNPQSSLATATTAML